MARDSGMSLSGLSKDMGRKRAFLSTYLATDRVPSVELMAEVCDASGHDLIVRNRETLKEMVLDPPGPPDEE